MSTKRSDYQYQVRKAALFRRSRAIDAPCRLCGKPIDWEAYDENPNADYGPSANHVTAINKGGHMLGPLELMHRLCNSKLQDKTVDDYLDALPERVVPTLTW